MNNSNHTAEYFEEIPEKGGFNPKEFILKYIRYWPYILLSVTLALAAAYLKNQYTTPTYKVESKFLIKEEDINSGILDLTGLGRRGTGGQSQRLANQSLILKSKPLAEEVLSHLDFDIEYYREGPFIHSEIYNNLPIKVVLDWEHNQLTGGLIKVSWHDDQSYTVELVDDKYQLAIPGSERKEQIDAPSINTNRFAFGDWTETDFIKMKIDLTSEASNGEIILRFRDQKSLVSQYSGEDLQVWPLDATSSILGLSLITTQPEKGQLYLNTLMEVFLDIELREKTRIASNTVEFIDSQISGVVDSLNYTGADLRNYRAQNRTYNIGTEGNTIFSQLSELERTISQEKYKKEYYTKLQDYLVREDFNEIVMPSGLGIDDPILNTLIENLIVLQAEKSRHLATQTGASPTVREVNRKINDLNVSIKEVLKNVQENSNYVISDLESQMARIESQFSRLPTTEQNLLRFQRKYDLNESIYTFLLQRRAESAITMASNTASNKIVEYAGLNDQPLQLKYMTNYVLALVFGFSLPVFFIALAQFFNNKVTDLKDAEKDLKVPVLTQIGRNRLKSKLVVLKEPRSAVTEAFRSLRTNIYFITPKDKQATIAVTSNISGEGKSFCALNLASAYSLNGKRTVLIDCDLHKHNDWTAFKIDEKLGLSSFLSDQIDDLPSIIQSSSYPNLDIITAGKVPPNPGELLLNGRMEELITILRSKYDTIILDTPPIGLVSESLGLIHLSDLTILVVRHGYSRKSFIDDINNLKYKKGIKNIYAVFNDVADKDLSNGGYGYGYYQEDRNKRPFLKRILAESGNVAT